MKFNVHGWDGSNWNKQTPSTRKGANQMKTEFAGLTEDGARLLTVCPGCYAEKTQGCVVCWDCFKGGSNPLKYFNGSFEEWLTQEAR